MSVYESTEPRGGGVTVAAALLAIVTIIGLYARPLLAIDETRYAAVALDMLQRGDWLVPHLNGAPYSHKPPLLFWLIVAGWKVVGVSLVWARVIGPLAGVGALGTLVMLSRALWPQDVRVRRWAPLITGGAMAFASAASLLMFDALLTCAALLALAGVVHAVEHDRRRGLWLLALGIAFGILAKGPVIFLHVLPVALLAPWWATPRADRRWGRWYLTLLLGVLLGAGGALLWAVPAGMAGGPDYQREIFLGQTTGRMVKSFAHRRPVWWYVPLLPVLFFPWFVWPESWRAVRVLRLAPRDTGVRFCLAWLMTGFVAFSLVSGKQMHYLVPLVPAVALLLGRGLSLREAAPLAQPWIASVVLAAVAALIVLAGTTHLADAALWWPHTGVAWWWAAVPFASAVMLIVWQRGRSTRNAAVHSLAVSTVALLCGLQLAAARAVSVPYDTDAMAAAVRAATDAGHPIAFLGAYNGEYHFAGRLSRVRIDPIDDSAATTWLATHRDGLLLYYERGRIRPAVPAALAQHPFRNGWVTLSPTAPPTGASVSMPVMPE